jgi:two-component system response regulator RegX3
MASENALAPQRILVVEDDQLQADSLAFILRQEGHLVEIATTGTEALEKVRGRFGFDLVLLDVALPELSGIEVARRLRAGSSVPIILLTARRQDSDKVLGLDAGADDYVTKPFSANELLARIRAQVRRVARLAATDERPDGVFRIGGLLVDVGTRRACRDGQPIMLSAREFDIVRILAEAAGQVVERQYLFASIWGPNFYGDERALDVYIRMIRKKLEPEPSAPRYLHTIRGVGFRLVDEPAAGGR